MRAKWNSRKSVKKRCPEMQWRRNKKGERPSKPRRDRPRWNRRTKEDRDRITNVERFKWFMGKKRPWHPALARKVKLMVNGDYNTVTTAVLIDILGAMGYEFGGG
ncbi:hypothetical protein B6U83_01070 [Thermoplasmatales archaeon ex4484_36]|nr:MAG: hypothetical protein B6U83_01070 [Thermoplasmatales archaeon ex4484_36]